jgi:Zn-dependent oligopeptidase
MRHIGIVGNWALADVKPDDLRAATEKLIVETQAKYDAIAAVKVDDVSFENCIRPLIDLECEQTVKENPLDFAQHCVTDKAIRDGLTDEQKRFVEKEIVYGRRNGLHLEDAKREEITTVKKRISELGTQFSSNLSEDTTSLLFDRDDLAGVPEDLVNSLEIEDGKLKVTTKYPHYFPITRKCRVPDSRRRMDIAFQSKCMTENTPILEELVSLRQKQAELLGYPSHAAYIQELRMAKDPDTVSKFLSDLAVKLQPIWLKEKEEMLGLKKKECEKYGYQFSGEMDFWDFRYYMNQVEETRYSVDQEKLKEFFPMETVTKGLLEIYQELLGLTFKECEEADTWHEEVKLYRVNDAESKETLGYFFLDLYPRDGKYGHAAIFSLQNSCLAPGGDGKERQAGVCAMMANFSKPTKDKPSLLGKHSAYLDFLTGSLIFFLKRPQRGRDLLSRVWPRDAHDLLADGDEPLHGYARRAGLCRGPESDARKLGLGEGTSQEDERPLQGRISHSHRPPRKADGLS